jgi:hypothetical protein
MASAVGALYIASGREYIVCSISHEVFYRWHADAIDKTANHGISSL